MLLRYVIDGDVFYLDETHTLEDLITEIDARSNEVVKVIHLSHVPFSTRVSVQLYSQSVDSTDCDLPF